MAGIGLILAPIAPSSGVVLVFLTVALAGLELTVAGSWAMALDSVVFTAGRFRR